MCTTDSNGVCSIIKSNIRSSVTAVTFAVDSVAYATYSYLPSANHDPDGDSNGTTISVSKP